MESKIINFDTSSRKELLEGVKILSDAVSVTMGPKGMNVVIENPGSHPIITKDGVTVAKAISLKDGFKNLGVEIVKEAASRTAETAGDGTTTATVLAHSIFSEGLKMMSAGHTSRDIINGIKSCERDLIENILSFSKEVSSASDIMQVATISANGEEKIGNLITEAISELGINGVVTVEDAKGFESDLVVVKGMQLNRGYLSPYFVNNSEKMIAELDNPRIFICNKKINSIHEISSVLEESLQSSQPVLIISNDIDNEAMQGLVINSTKGNLKVCAIKSPGFGNARVGMMEDLSMIVGTKIYSSGDEEEIRNITMSDLGTCSRVIVTRSDTTFIGSSVPKDEIEKRSKSIEEALSNPRLSDDERQVLRVRLSRLAGGVGIIRVGGATEGEVIERKDRVDDALNATQAAIEEGVVPGGGVTLLRASKKILLKNYPELQRAGVTALKNSCQFPIRNIVKNSGGIPDLVISNILKNRSDSYGFNASIGIYCDMFESGIIDPAKVTRQAVENAVSCACTLLSAGCAMINEVD